MIYKIRLGGTSEFVSEIDPTYNRCSPPGKVEVVKGWDNPLALVYETYEAAKAAADEVEYIEGFHTSVELIE
jgi:hypothetical protein